MPSAEDLKGAAMALARIQDVYDLPPDTILNGGKYQGTENSHVFEASDTFAIGKESFKLFDWKNAKLWMMKTLTYLEDNTSQQKPNKTDVLDYLAWAHYMVTNRSMIYLRE